MTVTLARELPANSPVSAHAPRRVLLLSNLFPSTREPTRGVFNRQGFHALSHLCEVRVLVPMPWWSRVKRPRELLQTPAESVLGMPARYPTYWSVPGRPAYHARGMHHSLRGEVRRLHREFPFDAVLAAWAYPDGVAAAHLAREFGVPLVTMVLGSDVNEIPRNPALGKQVSWGLQAAERVITVSAALRDRVIDLGVAADQVVVQRNGVDGERFRIRDRGEARRRLGLAEGLSWICYVGNLYPEKGPAVLIEAMQRIRANGRKDIALAIVGGGTLEAELRAKVDTYGLGNQVRFCGRRPHDEVPDWICACDVLCLPSYREGCPNVVLEALASGRPVVASAVGGVPELIGPKTGLLVAPGDPEALAGALVEAIDCLWEPATLRSSVPYLSWNEFGQSLYATLTTALHESVAKVN